MRVPIRLFLLAASALCLSAAVRLPALISDHMLLQQGVPVRIWGKASPGETVSVKYRGQDVQATAGSEGTWQVFLKPMPVGPAEDLTVAGENTVVVHDVLTGDVWVGSGQSNMEFPMSRTDRSAEEIAAANFPQIRLFTVKKAVAEQPLDDVQGQWTVCSPETVRTFSAVLYFFGREILQTQKMPMGLIHSSWGGTPAQSWTSAEMLKDNPALQYVATEWATTMERYPAAKMKYDESLAAWKEKAAEAKASGKAVPVQPRAPVGTGHPNTPSGLYNAMIAPLTPFAIRGALWYQGEANASVVHAYPYRRLFTSMIEDWRQQWGEGEFPFYLVQLANFRSNGNWPIVRESQWKALDMRNTGMAVTLDVGNPTDIHPTDKQDVGHRLALWARAKTYGEKVVYSGPLYRQMTTDGKAARIWLDSVGAGLELKRDGAGSFVVAGADRRFYPAQVKIDGNTLLVSSTDVEKPMAVRYAWQDDPPATLYNRDGLPASSFRTDHWNDARMPELAAK